MLNRIWIGFVLVFWVVMWTLLIRSEFNPGETVLREVPVEIVLKQFLRPGQPADLFIYNEGARVGHLRLEPKLLENTQMRSVDFFGNVQIDIEGAAHNRAFWSGNIGLTKELEIQTFHAEFTIRNVSSKNAAPSRVELTLLLAEKKGSYRVREGDAVINEGNFTLDEKGISALLESWGISSDWRRQITAPADIKPTIACRLTHMQVHEADSDAYLVTIASNGQTLLELRFSQLGQLLDGTTPFGWTLNVE
jgi:hypothetical protein